MKKKKQIRHSAENFKGLLNRPSPATRQEIPPTARTELLVDTNPPTEEKILNATKLMNTGRESSGARWDSPAPKQWKLTRRQRQMCSNHYYTRFGRKERCLSIENKLPHQAAKERRPKPVQELVWNQALVHAKLNTKSHHPVENKGCTKYRTPLARNKLH
ncbi:unnamed protein product [Trichobilharzia szidati]|nr:unnamed protein product [Trichobilharzia szidati]